MSRRLKTILLLFTFLTLAFVIAGGMQVKAGSDKDGAYRQLQVYQEVLSRIRSDYVEEPNIATVTDGALHGLLESLDANSSYLSPAEYQQYKQQKPTNGVIGAQVSKRYGYAAVVAVVPGGPAENAGVENSDIIEAIEGSSTHEMSLSAIRNLLQGQPGSVVNISVVRPRKAQPVKISITREVVKEPPVQARMMEGQIGYIRPDGFSKGRSHEIAARVQELTRQGATRFVLDLRGSASGEMEEGVATANLFLNHGTIGYVQGQNYPRQDFAADPSKAIIALPLVVIVNRTTAGPAELVAGAVLENARGDIVGDKTFGEGSITKLFPMPDGSALVLSIAKYHTPSGKAIQDTAITPNISVADSTDDFLAPDDGPDVETGPHTKKDQQDDQLHRAIEVLKDKPQKVVELRMLTTAASA